MTPLHGMSVCQVGIVVRDIEQARHAYGKLLGVEPPPVHITETKAKAKTRYRGSPTSARAKLVFFRLGNISLELIEPIGSPSVWQEHLDRHGEGAQHLAFRVTGMGATLAALQEHGLAVVQTGEFSGGRYAYVDGATLGVTLEFVEIDDGK